MECFPCSSKPGKWKDWDPEGTPAASNHFRTEPLSPGRHDRPPYEGKGLNRDWDLGQNGRTGVPKFLCPRDGSNPEKSTGDREISPRTSNPLYETKIKFVFGQLFLISPIPGPWLVFLSSCLMLRYANSLDGVLCCSMWNALIYRLLRSI